VIVFYCLYFLIGAFSGTFAGLLGIGGGAIVIPLLYTVLCHTNIPNGLTMHVAAATSLAIMIFTGSSTYLAHIFRGTKAWYVYKKLYIGIIVGTILGATCAHFINGKVLEIIFGIFMFFVSFKMIFNLNIQNHRSMPSSMISSIVSFFIGLKSGLLGIGGGALTIPFLTYCNVKLRDIIAISAACTLTIAVIGTSTVIITGSHVIVLPKECFGYIYLPALLYVTIGSLIFSQIGAHYSHKIKSTFLKQILGFVLLAMAIKILILSAL